jgi:immune inhibitor A
VLAALAFLAVQAAPAAAIRSTGELHVLVVLAGFEDRPLAHPRAYFAGTPDSLVDRFVAYYAAASSGRLTIVPRIGGPIVTLPGTRMSYVQRPGSIAHDAITAFGAAATDPEDREALDVADTVIVFFAGTGRESHVTPGDPSDPWSNYTAVVPPAGRFDDACIIAEEEREGLSPFGVLCHEFGHQLGLPELYAPGGRPQEGIGVWGLMGQGTWLGRGTRPSLPEAWSRAKLGWMDVQFIDRTTRGVELPAAEETPRAVRIEAVPGRRQEYYLLENRARIGADERLPGEGLLVWHVDERVPGFREGENDPAHKLLHLVEADGRNDLDRGHAAGGNRGDATDPWEGPPPWRRTAGAGAALLGAGMLALAVLRARGPGAVRAVLVRLAVGAAALTAAAWLRATPVCGPGTPGMAPYGGEPVRVVIRNISPAGPVMRFDVLVAPQP